MKLTDSVYHSNSVSFVRGQNGISEDYLWQSFDYLSDTLLEGMKCEWELRRSLTLEAAFFWKGSEKYQSFGFWNRHSTGPPDRLKAKSFFFNNYNVVYFVDNVNDKSVISKMVLNQSNYNSFQHLT